MVKVYIAGAIPEVGLNLLKEHFEVEMYEGEGIIDKETLMEGVKDASALISILSTNVDQEVIDSASNLKIIANYGAGFNNVDVKYAREKDIDVTNTPKASTASTAELTFGLVLAVARRIVEGDKLSRTQGFDVDILYTGPHQKKEKEREIGAKYVDLNTLLENADFITINAAYNPDLHHMIDTEQFKLMKSTAYLINAGRGPIVNEEALVKALEDKEIEGAALDVYEFEPEITEGLKSLDNVVITPHIGNATYEARDMILLHMLRYQYEV